MQTEEKKKKIMAISWQKLFRLEPNQTIKLGPTQDEIVRN